MNVEYCGKAETPIPSCHFHTHKTYEVIIQLTGNVRSAVGNEVYSLSPFDLLVIPPHISHNGVSDSTYTDMYVQAEELDFSDVTHVHDYDGSILTLMNLMHKVMTEKENNYQQIADNIMNTIVQYIKRLSQKNVKYPFVIELKNKIYENLSNPEFSISEEIAGLGFNQDYFRKRFKEEMSKTPLEYMTELRIEQAKGLLMQETFQSIESVAFSCGFKDNLYFSTCFRKHTGMSPMQYKKSLRK